MRFMLPSHASWVFIGRICSWWHVVRFSSIYRMYCVRANRLALSSNVRGHLEFYRKFISFITIFHYLTLSALRSSFHLLRFLVRHILSFTNRSQNRKRDDEGEEKSGKKLKKVGVAIQFTISTEHSLCSEFSKQSVNLMRMLPTRTCLSFQISSLFKQIRQHSSSSCFRVTNFVQYFTAPHTKQERVTDTHRQCI